MKLIEISIKNFKSLRDVTFHPRNFSILIGPNGAGKSNFANSLRFLSETYRLGLVDSVKRFGGFENIINRRRETGTPLEFTIKVAFNWGGFASSDELKTESRQVVFSHSFAINSDHKNSGFGVESETLSIKICNSESGQITDKDELVQIFELKRDRDGNIIANGNRQLLFDYREVFPGLRFSLDTSVTNQNLIPKSSLAIHDPLIGNSVLRKIRDSLSYFGIYSFSRLTDLEETLPSLVKNTNPDVWQEILFTMQEICPGLSDIVVKSTEERREILHFLEEGLNEPLIASDMSDGTILALASLCSAGGASSDGWSGLFLLEELENSLHPWALRLVLDRIRHFASKEKTVIITTHSPLLIDRVRPEEVFTISKMKGETRINSLVEIVPDLQDGWESGDFKTSDYLDSGLIPQAVPGITV